MGSPPAGCEEQADVPPAENGTSSLARRIGPVYTADDVARWLDSFTGEPLPVSEVRKGANERKLVGFLTDDLRWAFPAWQFEQIEGWLVVRPQVVAVWQQLPYDGVFSDVDLVAWMNTRLLSLDGRTPADTAHRQGVDDEMVAAAVSRLRARAA